MKATCLALLTFTLTLTSCTRDHSTAKVAASNSPSTYAPPDAAAAPAPSVPPVIAPTKDVFALPGIPLTTLPTPGALRVEGYPTTIWQGNSDAATPFGFTRDGSKFAYCQLDVCCREGVSHCMLVDAAGKTTTLLTPTVFADLDSAERVDHEPRTRSQLVAFAKEEKLLALGPQNPQDGTVRPPPPTGSFAYGGDMTLVVGTIAPTVPKNPDDLAGHVPGSVKIGARLAGEREVFVVFPRAPFCTKNPLSCYDAALNALVLSPDASELAFLVFIRNPSHGSTFAPARMKVATFAALVLNDTGMRHHEKKEWARAAELFTRAVYADPSEERFAYNLACALARQGDARAEHALRHAVSRGGDAVRARAQKDADFSAVRTQPWFTATLR